MNWLRENRFLGPFLIVSSVCTLSAVWFLWDAKNDWNDAAVRFHETGAELNRLERLAPYPSSENVRSMKAYVDDYANALARLKEQLKARVIPLQPLAPNEFQSRLRLAMTAVADKARGDRVRLPDKFCLGFDEFASALPNASAAPLLGQELAQVEWLVDALLEARVEALTFFRRTPLLEEHGTMLPVSTLASRKVGAMATADGKVIERSIVEATFVSTPAAARKVLNQIAGENQQFFIVRLLRIRNEKDKGPPREGSADSTVAVITASSPAAIPASERKPTVTTGLNFIVGNEHIEVTARIEIVRFLF